VRRIVIGLVTLVATFALALPAGAVPPGLEAMEGISLQCDDPLGDVTVYSPEEARMGWIGDALYQAVSIEATGTFTPTGGEPQPIGFSQTWGHGPPGELIHCSGELQEVAPEGTYMVTLEAWIVPVPGFA
jgi:hypothetical protein